MPLPNDGRGVRVAMLSLAAVLALGNAGAQAEVLGVPGPSFSLTAKADRISTPDGGSFLFWGFSSGGGRAQYPGPTLIVNQGQQVTVTVSNATTNGLPPGQRVALAFPGNPA